MPQTKKVDAIVQRTAEAKRRAQPVRRCPAQLQANELPPLPKNLPLYPPSDYACWVLGPNGMVSAWMDINYERALDCLVANINNRHMSERRVEMYSTAMLQDQWAEHHQGIAFNTIGELIDAQHRLEAIARTGKSYYMLVTWNVPVLAQVTIDDHKARTYADAAKVEGNRDTNDSLVATARRMATGLGRNFTLSKQELNWWLAAFKDGLYFAENCFNGQQRRGVTIAPVKAVLARAYYAEPKQRSRIEQFAKILYYGRADQPGLVGAESAMALHDKLRSESRGRFAREGHQIYAFTERMLRHFLDEVDRQRVVATTVELFELPNIGTQLAITHRTTEEEAAAARKALTNV